ncbi:AGAP001381-PA-like protein [Anopheles sinensis]|uniref:AGAP001381-PA-like protein n=1 Tax=Anopheles sinensis TaxID=74873 RepID=A0A084W259_ANOSI|nr:AGAP001381-PA-like protein [Anopheles sinensis]
MHSQRVSDRLPVIDVIPSLVVAPPFGRDSYGGRSLPVHTLPSEQRGDQTPVDDGGSMEWLGDDEESIASEPHPLQHPGMINNHINYNKYNSIFYPPEWTGGRFDGWSKQVSPAPSHHHRHRKYDQHSSSSSNIEATIEEVIQRNQSNYTNERTYGPQIPRTMTWNAPASSLGSFLSSTVLSTYSGKTRQPLAEC